MPVRQGRRIAVKPRPLDAGCQRNLVQGFRIDGRRAGRCVQGHREHRVPVDGADGCFGSEDAENERGEKQQDVLQLRGSLNGTDLAQNAANASRQGVVGTTVFGAVALFPKTIRVDNVPEFISLDLDLWAYRNSVTLDFSRPGWRANASAWSTMSQLRRQLQRLAGFPTGP